MSVFGVKTPLVNLRAQIVVVLSAVTGVGPVYDRVRRVDHQEAVQILLRDAEKKMAFWFVTLATSEPFANTRRYPASHSIGNVQFELFGYRALNDADASENTFHNHVAEVIEAFEADTAKKLNNGTVDLALEAGPIAWQTAGHVQMVDTLAHFARLVLPVRFTLQC